MGWGFSKWSSERFRRASPKPGAATGRRSCFEIVSGPLSIRTSPVSDLRLRNSGNSTFELAKSSLLCESTSFQALCSLEAVPGLRFSRRVRQTANRRLSRSLLADRSFKKRPSHTRRALKDRTRHHLSQLVRSTASRASSCTFQLVKTPISPAFHLQRSQDHKSTPFDLTRPSGSIPSLHVYTISNL